MMVYETAALIGGYTIEDPGEREPLTDPCPLACQTCSQLNSCTQREADVKSTGATETMGRVSDIFLSEDL